MTALSADERRALELAYYEGLSHGEIALARPDGAAGVGAAATANLIFGADDARVYVVGTGLTPPPGKDLQLWVIRGDQQI